MENSHFWKRVAALSAFLSILISTLSFAADKPKRDKTDGEGHVLVSLWKEYSQVREDDLPDEESAILEKIISQAGKQHLAWDFYDGWDRYFNVMVSRDWKQREALDSAMARAVREFDEPVVTLRYQLRRPYRCTPSWLLGFIEDNGKDLKMSRNFQFYSFIQGNRDGLYSDTLPSSVVDGISSDYEFALWYILLRTRAEETSCASGLMEQYLSSGSLSGNYFEYYSALLASSGEKRIAALQDFADSHAGEVVALFARQALIHEKFSRLCKKSAGTSDDFLRLLDECREFEKARGKFSGKDARVADDCGCVKALMDELESRSIDILDGEDTLGIRLRNIGSFTFEVLPEGKDDVLYSEEIDNPFDSFYRYDTVKVTFPGLSDGDYVLRCVSDETVSSVTYSHRTISLAYRSGESGPAVYAADRLSGRPLEDAEIRIYRRDTLVYSREGVDFHGFEPIDARLDTIGKTAGLTMVCAYTDASGKERLSDQVWLSDRVYSWSQGAVSGTDGPMPSCSIFKDRAVFRKGDTVSFKAVLYSGGKSPAVLPSGEKVKVYLTGTGFSRLDSLELYTNDFGSVSGKFSIPSDRLNGDYSIEVWTGKYCVATDSFTVGDIDIPTYDLVFDKSDTVYFPGDSIVISGTVRSYTGHSPAGARLAWNISSWNGSGASGELFLEDDGRFAFGFRDSTEANLSSYYTVDARVTDFTGETLAFSGSVQVAPRFYMEALLENPAEGQLLPLEYEEYSRMSRHDYGIMSGDVAKFRFNVQNAMYETLSYPVVDYVVCHGNELVISGKAVSGEDVDVDLTGCPSGLYRVEATASMDMMLPDGRDSLIVFRCFYDLARIAEGDTSLDFCVKNLFKVVPGEDIVLQMGATDGPVWAVTELWGEDAQIPLEAGMVYLDGQQGREGSLITLRHEFKESYPDEVRLVVFYFKDGRNYEYRADYRRSEPERTLPLEFASFTDRALPGEQVSMTLRTLPETESAVTVFDAATEQIMPNVWSPVTFYSSLPYVSIYAYNGSVGRGRILVKGAGNSFASYQLSRSNVMAELVSDESMAVSMAQAAPSFGGGFDVEVRDEFLNTLAFFPMLHTGRDSTVTFSFRTSDKVSTYNVSVFSHDRRMRNNAVTGKMLVSRPLVVSVLEPRFLREGDRYILRASVSNDTGAPVCGVLALSVYDTDDYEDSVPVMVREMPLDVQPGKTGTGDFEMEMPSGTDVAGFKVVYVGTSNVGGEKARWSDGLFASVDVFPDVQVLTEAHSAVLLPGMDMDSLRAELSGRFRNTLPYGAETRAVSLLDLVKTAIPQKARVCGKDAVSVSDALFVRMLTGCISGKGVDSLVLKISECQNADGGFAWFSGMNSSAAVTDLLLERAAEISHRTHVDILNDGQVKSALGFIDRTILENNALSLPEYLYVRSMYPSFPLDTDTDSADEKKLRKEFREKVMSYLSARGGSPEFDGRLIDKARRVSVLMGLTADSGEPFAESLGLERGFLRKASKQILKDVESLCGYAAGHASGGMYYPNAVMPFRGFLDSELYAHSLICDVLQDFSECFAQEPLSVRAAEIAEGLRLWMMIQKETQQWESDPAFVRAVASVLDGSVEVLGTEIVIMTKKYEKPFDQIAASGNGMNVSRKYYRETGSGANRFLVELAPGDTLYTGDKVVCRYEIWSSENRSFVKLSVPHSACARPVSQVSGMTGWVPWSHYPAAMRFPVLRTYRNVLEDKTEYYADVLPEETTVIQEEFFVTHEGEYSAPAVEVECVYAPHYRANGDGMVKLQTTSE